MIKKTNNSTLLILCIFLLFGCSNRFEKNENLHSFSFGLAGYDDFQYCKKFNPNFIKKYSNNVNPTRACTNYQYYTCHVTHYCNGDKQCEMEAAQYWTPNWTNAHGDLEKKISISKKVCEAEARDCNSAKPGDQTCRR